MCSKKVVCLTAAIVQMAGGMIVVALDVFPDGARSTAVGGASATIADIYSIYNNQAALGLVNYAAAAMNYQNRYLLPEMSMAAAAFVVPIPRAGTAGVSVCSFGTMPYNELRAGMAMGRQLGTMFAVGAQVNYIRIAVQDYGSTSSIAAEAGVLMQPIDNLTIGAHVFNFTYSKFFSSNYNEPLPVVFKLGAGYSIIDGTAIFVQGDFYSGQNVRLRVGVEYSPMTMLSVRAGLSLKPVQLSAGAGCTLRSWTIDFAVVHHESLGFSPQASLIYSFGRTTK